MAEGGRGRADDLARETVRETDPVSVRRTAFHSAALKAEKVLTDIKADFKPSDLHHHPEQSERERSFNPESQPKETREEVKLISVLMIWNFVFSSVKLGYRFKLSMIWFVFELIAEIGSDVVCVQRLHGFKSPKWKPLGLGSRQDWQDRIKNVRRKKAGGEGKEKPLELSSNVSDLEEYLDQVEMESSSLKGCEKASHANMSMRNASKSNSITPAAAVKQLAIAVEPLSGLGHSPGRTEGAASAISSFPRDIHVEKTLVINCCTSRKRRHTIASESLNSILREANSNGEDLVIVPSQLSSSFLLYAKVSTGDFILRLGADGPSESLTMLETGEPIYSPITQEGPIITEDFIRETEELVLRTGSVGAGCSQLLSDMQAFKAANPGCILEDFVRWHSPPDWTETDNKVEEDKNIASLDTIDSGDVASRRGNLWRELWETAKPLPAVKQTPLYDEDLAVEGILNSFEEISPVFLFQQLFVSLLGSGLAIAEGILPMNDSLIKLFYECKEYVIATCQGDSWIDNVDDLCQVYETVERILVNPEECLRIMKQSEETTGSDEPKRRFKKLSINFGVKDRQFLKKPGLFSKKPPKPSNSPQVDESSITDENDWTVV
ncbi:hypothetical protein Syun_010014 [Stephania yunnanensis]|uniref:Rab3GAP catalytic subunit conserved domain-containing protein n=1 Tax=Stephania yunnanensis TaxID=152371 RepID=A0AAP0PRE1_9MAGN